jgi:hypothetical protein
LVDAYMRALLVKPFVLLLRSRTPGSAGVRDWSAMMEQGSPVAPYIRSGLDRSPKAVCAGRSGRGGSFYGTCRERGLASYRHTPSRARLDTEWRRRSLEEAASTRAPRPQESDHLSDSATSLPSACGRGRRCRSGVAVCLRRQNVPATSASGRIRWPTFAPADCRPC